MESCSVITTDYTSGWPSAHIALVPEELTYYVPSLSEPAYGRISPPDVCVCVCVCVCIYIYIYIHAITPPPPPKKRKNKPNSNLQFFFYSTFDSVCSYFPIHRCQYKTFGIKKKQVGTT